MTNALDQGVAPLSRELILFALLLMSKPFTWSGKFDPVLKRENFLKAGKFLAESARNLSDKFTKSILGT